MQRKLKITILVFCFLFVFGWLPTNHAFSGQIAVKKQADGTIKMKSTPTRMKAQISYLVYCRAIKELIEEEKDRLNKLVSESRFDEAKDSIDVIRGLHELRTEECREN